MTATPAPPASRRQRRARPAIRILAGCGAVALAVALPFTADPYTLSLACYALPAALVAVSTHLVTNVAGLPSLGQGAYYGIGAYIAALIARTVTSNGPTQMLAAALAAAVLAAAAGAALVHTRATTFLLASLALGELAHTVAEHARPLTGGADGLTTPPVTLLPGLAPLAGDRRLYPYLLGCFLLVAGTAGLVQHSGFGFVVAAVAANQPRMRASGYPVQRYLLATYLSAAVLASAAGALLVAARRLVAPTDLAFDTSALALLAAVIGRRGVTATLAAALAVIAVRDLAGTWLPGLAPTLLGLLFTAVAVTRCRHPRAVAS
jgi:branched-chain amino acid transport system permease protein